jgi:predicted flap endonuclease-1-like 5' DNA nuclease
MKKLLRFALVVTVIAAIVWLTRERLLPPPRVVPNEPRPPYRSTPPAPKSGPDDLTVIKGIGPVYSRRLNEAGVRSFRGLTEIDAAGIAQSVGVAESVINDWIAQARSRLS